MSSNDVYRRTSSYIIIQLMYLIAEFHGRCQKMVHRLSMLITVNNKGKSYSYRELSLMVRARIAAL